MVSCMWLHTSFAGRRARYVPVGAKPAPMHEVYRGMHHRSPATSMQQGVTVYQALPPSKASIEELLEAGVHFGHRVTKWNPRMAPYIYGERSLRTGDTRVHILDVVQTLHYLNETSKFLHTYGNATTSKVGTTSAVPSILFVGTKKQARASIERAAFRVNGAQSVGDSNNIDSTLHSQTEKPHYHAHYVNHRWLGGLLTNWTTMKLCIDLLHSFDEKSKTGALEKLPKKEQAIVKKQYQKLETFFGGMKTMQGRPNLVIIVGQDSEMNAVRECQKLQDSQGDWTKPTAPLQGRSIVGVTSAAPSGAAHLLPLRTITLLDTNCDPQLADLFIPANDDSTKSIDYILQKLTDACIA